ncbi:hypothetical protein Barb6XT_02102 [Bacteroidales bacterium Barb6XT]|nr:hypothetical protein Barb6XT_02102 [Bacteroidales bacterium Barb6XT]
MENHQSLMLRRNPEGMGYFSPTCSAAECGVYGQSDPMKS